jgi:hypothetical protein
MLLAMGVYIWASSSVYSHQVIKVDNGYGYSILKGDKTFIHQPFIPGVVGQKTFTKKQQAEKAAKLVINKLENKKHPGLTQKEIERIISD